MRRLPALLAAAALAAVGARAELAAEPVGRSFTLPERPGPHWFWLTDLLLHRTALFDADTGDLLGTLSAGTAGLGFVIAPLFSHDHREIYLAETYYARGVRGERTDVVNVYDGQTLAPLHEIAIPPKRAEYYPGNAANALSDDGRFVAVFNSTPATSLSIVDVRERRFVAEVGAPGCGLVFGAGARRFLMLCGDGAALVVTVDAAGRGASAERTAPFFDPNADPLTEKAVRRGDEWLFVSFEGMVHPLDVSGPALRPGEPWPLFDEGDRSASWRIGGGQHLAVHAASGRLYALVHQGEKDTHKEPGREAWVYDLATRQRVQRIALGNPFAGLVRQQAGVERGGAASWLLDRLLPHPGVGQIFVTQDESPVLVAVGEGPGSVLVHDARSGALLREIGEAGIASTLLYAP
ncbi:MAG TPA: amine dehydrogenase large subunit [Myxococcota bacterium]|nr:amine dehydrogenase large subunit [Myxococcota bacterium]